MGNKICRRRHVVDEKYTRPQGLYQHKDIDHKKLRKLILDSKLAPCYPGDEDCALDLEECPICFLYYPSLNRSRCCMKGICTECFLQMKPPHATRPTQCPFCKTANYAVEYRGVKTKEERGIEQVEEQKVIEAQIRMRQQELQDEIKQMKMKQNTSSSSSTMTPVGLEYDVPARAHIDAFPAQASCSGPASMRLSHTRQNRDNNFDLDLEDIMVMEAIWLSIQEQGNQANPISACNFLPGPSLPAESYNLHGITPMKGSSSAGLACAAAALAERQHMNGDTANLFSSNPTTFEMLQQSDNLQTGNLRYVQNNPPEHWIEVSPDVEREVVREEYGEFSNGPWSTQAEASSSYAGSDVLLDAGAGTIPMLESANAVSGNFVPESFEEQMMLAMAVSLAEAQARMNNVGFSWM